MWKSDEGSDIPCMKSRMIAVVTAFLALEGLAAGGVAARQPATTLIAAVSSSEPGSGSGDVSASIPVLPLMISTSGTPDPVWPLAGIRVVDNSGGARLPTLSVAYEPSADPARGGFVGTITVTLG